MIQFCHNRKPNSEFDATIAIDVPSKEALQQMLNMHTNQLMIKTGFTIKSPHDDFVKKIGREISEQRLISNIAQFYYLKPNDLRQDYCFYIDNIIFNNKTYHLSFCLSTCSESNNVRLVSANLLTLWL